MFYHKWEGAIQGKCNRCSCHDKVVYWDGRYRRDDEGNITEYVDGGIPLCGICFHEKCVENLELKS